MGVAGRVASADALRLAELSATLDRQYFRFRAKIPFRIGAVLFGRVWGTGEFSTFRLNDMFLLYSTKQAPDYSLRYLVSSVLLYQTLLLGAFIPRGGLGFGLVLRGAQSVLGSGFIDAYGMAEERPDSCKDICAILVSPAFLTGMQHSVKAQRLLCFYENCFYVDPRGLVDPEMGEFSDERILGLLRDAGANETKLNATRRFLEGLESYEAAAKPGSRAWEFVRRHLGDVPGASPAT